jgi:hypothetical protein
MPSSLTPTVVKQRTFTTDELSRKADPEWVKDRNYTPAYRFGRDKRKFVDHRDNVYQEDE